MNEDSRTSFMSRITSFKDGEIVHCIHRGVMGVKIFRDESDYWRFLRLAYLCNDKYQDNNLGRTEKTLRIFERPSHWPEREQLVDILSFVVMPNHFHLLLRQRSEGGIGKFMQRLASSITNGFNHKYENKGTIFQSKYKPVIVTEDHHLSRLISYINVKNVCELYPNGGLSGAVSDFEAAYKWAKEYKFSSLRNWTDDTISPLLDMEEILESRKGQGVVPFYSKEEDFKELSRQLVFATYEKQKEGKSDLEVVYD